MAKYIAYYRVSTDKQGQSGLGLEAQQAAVSQYRDDILSEFVEVESGKNDQRPQLAAALAACREHDAAILIAKIDRLSRDAAFLLTLRKSGVDIIAADMPHCGSLEFGIRAVVAQHEREEISRRTKAALQAAKARGVRLGSTDQASLSQAGCEAIQARADALAQRVYPIIQDIMSAGIQSLRDIAQALTSRGIKTARGNTSWQASQVRNIIIRMEAA